MPALKPTEFKGRVTFLGRVEDSGKNLRAVSLEAADLTLDGIAGDCHAGRTRASCSRVVAQYAKGTEIANVRQLSVVSEEELALIAAEIGVPALSPAQLGASLALEGIPDLTHLPPSARLQFASGATITIDMENRPCVLPGRVIEEDSPGHGKAFKAAATHRRGVTAWVERTGPVKLGDAVTLHIPDQAPWSGAL